MQRICEAENVLSLVVNVDKQQMNRFNNKKIRNDFSFFVIISLRMYTKTCDDAMTDACGDSFVIIKYFGSKRCLVSCIDKINAHSVGSVSINFVDQIPKTIVTKAVHVFHCGAI